MQILRVLEFLTREKEFLQQITDENHKGFYVYTKFILMFPLAELYEIKFEAKCVFWQRAVKVMAFSSIKLHLRQKLSDYHG
jgi:hypothetical protein